MSPPSALRLAPVLGLALLVVPMALGLVGVIRPALGYLPALGRDRISLDAFRIALDSPGFAWSVWLALWTGPAAALAALTIVMLFFAGFVGTRAFAALAAGMAPILAIPHAAAGFGLAFLIAPSGALVRLVSPELSGFERPPDWLILNDPAGLSLLAGLVVKEVPFLFLVALAALGQFDAPARLHVARMLGYGRVRAFVLTILPALYPRIRLPVYAVIAFAGSVVDLALILGPGAPAPLAIRILQWMNDPDLAMRPVAAAGALVQLAVTLASLGLWRLGEIGVGWIGRRRMTSGHRGRGDGALRALGFASMALVAFASVAGVVLLLVWSLADSWRFPDALPGALTLDTWRAQGPKILSGLATAAVVAGLAALISSMLAIAILEDGDRRGRAPYRGPLVLFNLPLLVPQIAFLSGLALLLIGPGLDGTLGAVLAVHLVFVFPYVYLTLAGSWPRFDRRYTDLARLLGRSPDAGFWAIKLPMLALPILTAFGLGFAVSVAQYLPTRLIGAGRIATITTEAVALASGGDRRLIGAYGLAQTALAFAAFLPLLVVIGLAARSRRGMAPGKGA